ncbi:hypothetical protein GCM10009839_43080 [Catenulispora yoronensis]|uniref:DUF8083 domain-containing protein n=1 Tax=Catenulispora yoronensis TaxID=450799 RepID=A0ABN2UGM1_9ACTN
MRASPGGAIPAPYMAYLRVYEPLAAFPAGERTAWEGWLGRNPDGASLAHEQALALRALIAVPPIAVPENEERVAYVMRAGEATLLCPWQSRLRSWLALTELRAVHGDGGVRLYWPQAVLDRADSDYDRWWAEDPEALPHILTSSWQIPIRWLVLFGQEDGVAGEGHSLVFRTAMSSARKRCARGLRVLKRSLGAGPLVEAVETLGMWLEEFHPLSIVELDYGGLMGLLVAQGAVGAEEREGGVVMDCSVRYVAEGLAALAEGDDAAVTSAYLRYRVKWDAVRLLARAN